MRSKQAEDSPNPLSGSRHPSKHVSFIKEFAGHVSNAFGLTSDLPSPPSQTDNDANLMTTFNMLSLNQDPKQRWFYGEDFTPTCKPGPSGTGARKIVPRKTDEVIIQIPEFTTADSWITKDQDYQLVYNDDSEWDYIPHDSPLKGKGKATRVEKHFDSLLLPPTEFQQYNSPPAEDPGLPRVEEFLWGKYHRFGSRQGWHGGKSGDLRRWEDRGFTEARPLSKRYKSLLQGGAIDIRFHLKENGVDGSQDVVVRIPSYPKLDNLQRY